MKGFDGKKCSQCASCCAQKACESDKDPSKEKYVCPGALVAHAHAKRIVEKMKKVEEKKDPREDGKARAKSREKKPVAPPKPKERQRAQKRGRDDRDQSEAEDDGRWSDEEDEEENADDLDGADDGDADGRDLRRRRVGHPDDDGFEGDGGGPVHPRRSRYALAKPGAAAVGGSGDGRDGDRGRRGEHAGDDGKKEEKPEGKADPIARKGPLASHAMTDARALESILDAIANARYRPQDVASVTAATAILRAELFSASADVLLGCLRATSEKPTERTYVYRFDMDARGKSTRLALGMALRAATRWGEAFAKVNFARHAADAAFAAKGTAFLDKAAKVSAEMAFWSTEIAREQPNEMRGEEDLPTEYDLAQQADFMVMGLHLATVRPRSLRTFMDKHSRHLVAAFVKDNKKNLLSYSAWQAKHGAKGERDATSTAAEGGRRAFRGRRGRRGGGLSGGGGAGQSGGGKGTPAAASGGAAAASSGAVPAVYGSGNGPKKTRTKCSTCGKFHLGACWHAGGGGGGGGRAGGRGGRGRGGAGRGGGGGSGSDS